MSFFFPPFPPFLERTPDGGAQPPAVRATPFGEPAAPNIEIRVNGILLQGDITKNVARIEFDETEGSSSMMTLVILNPAFSLLTTASQAQAIVADKAQTRIQDEDMVSVTALQQGNEIQIKIGYGNSLIPLGRAIVFRHLPGFPQENMPTFPVKAYDIGQYMKGVEGPVTGLPSRVVNLVTQAPKRGSSTPTVGTRFGKTTRKNYEGWVYGSEKKKNTGMRDSEI